MAFIMFFWQTFSKCDVVKSCTVSKKRDKAGLFSQTRIFTISISSVYLLVFCFLAFFSCLTSCFLTVWISSWSLCLSVTLSGKLSSMGYGFVQYKSPEAAQKAMRQLQVNDHLLLFHCCIYVLLLCTIFMWWNRFRHLISLLLSFFLQHCKVDEHQLELKISEREVK